MMTWHSFAVVKMGILQATKATVDQEWLEIRFRFASFSFIFLLLYLVGLSKTADAPTDSHPQTLNDKQSRCFMERVPIFFIYFIDLFIIYMFIYLFKIKENSFPWTLLVQPLYLLAFLSSASIDPLHGSEQHSSLSQPIND